MSPSLSVVVAERLENPEPKVEEREDLADVDSLAALLPEICVNIAVKFFISLLANQALINSRIS